MDTPEESRPAPGSGEPSGEGIAPELEQDPPPTLEDFRRQALSQALLAELGSAERALPLLFRAARRDARRLFRAVSEAGKDAAGNGETSRKTVKLLEKTAARLADFRRRDPPTLRDLVELLEKLEKAEARLKGRPSSTRRRHRA